MPDAVDTACGVMVNHTASPPALMELRSCPSSGEPGTLSEGKGLVMVIGGKGTFARGSDEDCEKVTFGWKCE